VSRIYCAALLLLAASITGCSKDLDQRYLDASLGAPLELPPDLIGPERESEFDLPDTISGDAETGNGERPVLAKVESMQLQSSGNLYWLSVEEPVGDLYRLVRNFWASEGYRLSLEEPAIGIMQTEWVYKEVGTSNESDNWFMRLFDTQDLSATQDQFRTRIERVGDGENRVYITHRGTEYRHVLDRNDRGQSPLAEEEEEDNEWRHRQPDHELEVEMLSRLMLYLGLQKAAVDQQRANVKLYQPRAFIQFDGEENSPVLLIRDPYQIAWNKVLHYLEQLNFEIESSEFKSGLAGEGVFVVNSEVTDNKEEKGFFSGLFSGDSSENRQFILVLSEETHELTRVEIETIKGELDSSPEGAQFLELLYQQIK
jgi:outer membrane protein assembly factor BamC